jgi:hypothetical protein
MASRYAPGTQQFDMNAQAGADRRARRSADWASGLQGFASLANTMGNINQRNQAYADQQAAMPYMMQAYSNPTGSLAEGQYGPTRTPSDAAMMAASNQSPEAPSFLHNMGTAFGFIPRQGNLTPNALFQIQQVQANQNQERRLSAAEARTAELHPLNKARLGLENAAAQDSLQFNEEDQQFKRAIRPVQADEAMLELKGKKQALEFAPAQNEADLEVKKANAAAANAHANYYNSGGASGGGSHDPRWDILAGKVRTEQAKLTELADAYQQRWDIDNGKVAQDKSPLMLNVKYGGLSANALRELMTQSRQLLDQYQGEAHQLQGGGPQGQPGPTLAAPQGTQVDVIDPRNPPEVGAEMNGGMQMSFPAFLREKGIDPHNEALINSIPPDQWKRLKMEWGAGG